MMAWWRKLVACLRRDCPGCGGRRLQTCDGPLCARCWLEQHPDEGWPPLAKPLPPHPPPPVPPQYSNPNTKIAEFGRRSRT